MPLSPRLLKKHKLEHHRKAIEAGLSPAVRIWYRERPNPPAPPGASKLGGEPDLHWSQPWAAQDGRPLHFLAQLNLSEVAKHLPKGLLPPRGRISLWYNYLGELKREERTNINLGDFLPSLLHLTFEPDEARLLERRSWPIYHETFRNDDLTYWAPYPETPVFFRSFTALSGKVMKEMTDAEEQAHGGAGFDRWLEFLRELEQAGYRSDGDHRILGDVYEYQSDNRFTAACTAASVNEFAERSKAQEKRLRAEASRYRLLIKLDSDRSGPGFSWGDEGALEWWIRDDHLKKHQLTSAIGIYEQGC